MSRRRGLPGYARVSTAAVQSRRTGAQCSPEGQHSRLDAFPFGKREAKTAHREELHRAMRRGAPKVQELYSERMGACGQRGSVRTRAKPRDWHTIGTR